MNDKLSELSKPDLYLRRVDRGTGEPLYTPCGKDYPRGKGYYSQEYVSALLAELEAKAQCITGLERHVKDLEATLIAATDEVADLTRERDEARAKLATPVRLPEKYNMKMAGDKSTKSMFYGHNSEINDSAKAIREAGFTVEGDEQ
ncbi:hypothetical protein [Serratia ficaria]|uniref:hypothetical protein n=1 Tax=Serratia ficaria TaxID=61651 RepID=UPI002183BD1E|nr:hypothetical protein [Serratia ficaria]CAI2516032.1 Uncharacterised protein [Serratia ficaria]